MSQVFSSIGYQPYFYGRTQHETRDAYSKLLSEHLDNKPCLITPSGMSAINVVLESVTSKAVPNTYLMSTAELYCDTHRVLKHYAGIYNLQYQVIDYSEPIVSFADKHVILFTEIVSNPNGNIIDLELLSQLQTCTASLTVIIDITWTTASGFNPFTIPNVTHVVSSLSKYYSGSSCIAGAIWCRDQQLSDTCFYFLRLHGLYVAPHICQMLIDAWSTFETRMQQHQVKTQQVLSCLNHPNILAIQHPKHNNNKYISYFTNPWFPVFTITCKGSKNKLLKVIKKNQHLVYKTSFGSSESRVDPWPKVDNDNHTLTWRVSVGYDDDVNNIVVGINDILDKM